MKGGKINTDQVETSLKPNVLVAPLDWGLGHTTRCIPLIRSLLRAGCRVFLAGDKNTKAILTSEFPELDFFELKGYQVRYTKRKWSLPLSILRQLPKIKRAITYEHEWLNEMISRLNLDAVISDNRYGLFSKTIRSVIVTHQLELQTPFQFAFGGVLRRKLYDRLENFDECWIPDHDGAINLAGSLSHPRRLPNLDIKYLGALTRFSSTPSQENKDTLLFILSGPEPQRTVFENLILEEARHSLQRMVLVRGAPMGLPAPSAQTNLQIHDHLASEELAEVIDKASLIICRSGYSTVMDLTAFRTKAVFVPTPGQTEQEYLAKHLSRINFAPYIQQTEFSIKKAVQLSEEFQYRINTLPAVDLDTMMKTWTNRLTKQISKP